ncbi:hypothetical protein EV361DRAFT_866095 [Lentinula raphanica]|nr:hypothetical protein EV361DRAFT_866095 [Lentinula raphanica]
MPSSIRQAFKQKTNTVIGTSSPETPTPILKSSFMSSLRGRSGSKSSKRGESESPSKRKRPIKTSDITYIFPEDMAASGSLSSGLALDEGVECDEDGRLSRPASPPLIIDKALVDQFPLPPVVHAYTSPDVRVPVQVPSFETSSSNELLPSLHPRVQQYMAEQKVLNNSLDFEFAVVIYKRGRSVEPELYSQANGSFTEP